MDWIFEIWEWIDKNKEWFLSGFGIFVLGCLGFIAKWLWGWKKKESDKNDKKKDLKPLKEVDDPQIIVANPDPTLETEIRTYREKAASMHNSLPVAGFATHLKVPIDIEDIYIPLRAMVNLRGVEDVECYGDSCAAEKHLAQSDAVLEISLLNAFSEAEKRRRKGLVILGDPGSGKTTHMKRMLLWCLHKGPETMGLSKDMLPVFLPLRELKQVNKGLDRFIQDQLTSRHLQMSPDFGKRMMKRGHLLFLLDGLDEVADLAQREEVSGWIEEAFTDYPDCRFVVTCRYAGYSPSVRLSEKFLEMHVRPLSDLEAERFVRNWYSIVEKNQGKDMEQAESIAQEKADDLVERLAQPDFRARRVFELTRNPLLLTNICLVHRHRGALPQRRARLYEECTDVLLEYWRRSKKLDLGVNALEGRQVLQPAALWLHQKEGRTKATANELAHIIQPALKKIQWPDSDAQNFLRIIRDESGLLTGWSDDQYGFMHLGFQEYLAAREIRSRFQAEMNEQGRSEYLKNLAKHFGESWWQEVTLLLLALEDPPLFVPYMREVVCHPAFAEHADLVEMCLDDAVMPSSLPFVELLENEPGTDHNLWERQLLSLRMVERLDKTALESIMYRLQGHPYNKISQWINNHFKQAYQIVIRPEPSGYELVLINGGTFMMGSDERISEKPMHKVTVPDFYMGRYPVTNEEYGRFIKATRYQEPLYWGDRNFNQAQQPVVGVSWHDAKTFAKWSGLQLPSEAQWEYACRAGSPASYCFGNQKRQLMEYAWFFENSKSSTHPVAQLTPNAWGLYDMHGNVWEWCNDYWHDNYNKAPDDGTAWADEKSARIVLRGGSWDDVAGDCRSASRLRLAPISRFYNVGFRLVCYPGQQCEPNKASQGDA